MPAAKQSQPTSKLFYVRADNEGTGDNLDLMVRCETEKKARTAWKEYYEEDDDDQIQWVGVVPDDVEGAIPWDSINPTPA